MGPKERQRGSRSGEQGYILALLLGICVVMGIFMEKAIPADRAAVQRELEAELIYRGEHIAKGIRTYVARTGGYPIQLEALTKLRPRLVRKIYKDPMTKDGAWDLVMGVQVTGKSGSTEGFPIVGVRSKNNGNSFRMYRNKTLYSDWVFSAADNLLGIPGGQGQGPQSGGPNSGGGRETDPAGGQGSNTKPKP